MDFTIAIPCRNRIHVANEAIKCFIESCDYPILVIDDNSDIPTSEYTEHPRVKVIFNKYKQGYSAIVNQCICESTTEYIIIASDKIRVKPVDIERIESKLTEGFACVCTRLMHIYGFSKDLITKIGLFDSGFTEACFEDTDWMNRLFVNNLSLYFSVETDMANISTNWVQNSKNNEYYSIKWEEDNVNNKLIQLNPSKNVESMNLFRGKYPEKKYLDWNKSNLKVDNVSNYYNGRSWTKEFRTPSVTSFMYHDVRNIYDSRYKKRYELKSFLTVEQFEKQIKYITERYKVISGKNFLDLNNIIDDKYAILTFDDGLLDHYENVMPILKHYGVSGTFCIPTGPVVGSSIIHSHKIQFILSCANSERDLVERIFNTLCVDKEEKTSLWSKFSKPTCVDSWWSDEMIFVTNILRNYTDKKYEVVDNLFCDIVTSDVEKFNSELYLNEDQVSLLVKNGMEIGSHGFSSENLILLSESDSKNDLYNSLEFIKSCSSNDFTIFSDST